MSGFLTPEDGPLKVIDAHAHIWLSQAERDRRELVEALDKVPIERIYVSGLHGHDQSPDTVVRINDAVHEMLAADPRARGQAYLNPRHGQHALEELRRCHDLGFCMVKLWVATRADDPLNFPVYEAAAALGMPLLLHSFVKARGQLLNESTPWDVAEAARRYPECTFLMAHMGGDFIFGCESVAELPNVFVDPSGSYGEKGMIEYAVQRLGADRVIFGSDMPGSDIYHNLGKVVGASISDAEREAILHRNAERVLP